jgi:hypothetical protein
VNQQAFESRLVSFLSLKREGHDRITGVMVSDRIESMNFIFQMLGLPLEPSAVVLVEDIFSENSPCPDVRAVSGLSLTTIRTTSADRLGAFVPLGEIARSAEFQRPLLATTVGCLRRCLSVTSATDVQLAVDRMGATVRLVVGEALAGSTSIVPWKAASAVIAPSSKLESRMTAAIANAQALLANLNHENWGDLLKESAFTKPLNGFIAMHSEAVAVGDDRVADMTKTWLAGLQHGKNFLKMFREYGKSHHKHPKLVGLSQSLLPFSEFVQDVKVSSSFVLLFLKVVFFDDQNKLEGFKLVGPAFQLAIGKGLAGAFQKRETHPGASSRVVAPRSVNPDVWLRSMLFKGLEISFGSMTVDTFKEDRRIMMNDVGHTRGLLDKAWADHKSDISTLQQDLDAVSTILKVGEEPPVVSATEVESALRRLKTDAMKQLSQAIDEEPCCGLLESASAFVARSAQDQCADKHSISAMNFLADERMPSVSTDAEQCVLTLLNFELIKDMSVIDILTESIDGVNEATTMWSSIRLEESCSSLKAWGKVLMDILHTMDIGLSWQVCDRITVVGLLDSDAGNAGEMLDLPQAFLKVQRSKHVLEDWIGEDDFHCFIDTFIAFVDSFGGKKDELFGAFAERLRKELQYNYWIRDAIFNFLKHLFVCSSSYMPSSPQDALDELRVQESKGTPECSFLRRSLCLRSLSIQLQARGNFRALQDYTDWKVKLADSDAEETDRAEPGHYDWQDIVCLPSRLVAALPLLPKVSEMLEGTVQLTFRDLMASIATSSIKLECVHDLAELDEASVLSQVDLYINCHHLNKEVIAASRIFDPKARNTALPCRVMANLFLELYDQFMKEFDFTMEDPTGFIINDGSAITISKMDLMAMLLVMTKATEVVSVLGYLKASLALASQFVHNHTLRVEVLEALMSICLMLSELRALLTDVAVKEFEAKFAWAVSPLKLSVWATELVSFMSQIKIFCLVSVAEDMEKFGQTISKSAPKVDHFINDENYLKPLAKKHLLDWKGRQAYSDNSIALYKCMAGLKGLHTQLGVASPLDGLVGDQMKVATSIFAEAKALISIIAHVNVVQGMSGAEQKSAAIDLVAKKCQVPKALFKELEAIAVGSVRGLKRKATL